MSADTYRGLGQPAPAEFQELHDAMQIIDPACLADDRFTADNAPVGDLAPICAGCPLTPFCEAYALAARPSAGVWAGRRYGSHTGRVGRPRKDAA
ncbi:WhiB family transcriptional regulator [Gulosibacter sediminis]|uniref:WhiB family transcriptional regulator n=1 Tax=Gulosibacter sediminis TaxID=1729695 RepID=UPI0024A8F18A|nr:WhiB family transcriptional regulator [Gulosibacter sediminis]